jgi:uroporphyrinogen III methyltransferase/synthase
VTRAREQAAGLIGDLETLGAEVIAFPVIRIIDPPDFSAIDEAIEQLETYDWIVLTSANGVERFFARLEHRMMDPAETLADLHAAHGTRVAAVGSATARLLEERGVTPDLMPDDFRGEGLAAALLDSGVGEGARILVPRALVGRDVLASKLGGAGATVEVAPVYQTVAAEADPAVVERLRAGVDAVTFTSPSTVKHFIAFLEAAGVDARAFLESTVVASIGPVTTDALEKRGYRADVQPGEYTAPALAAAIVEYFSA